MKISFTPSIRSLPFLDTDELITYCRNLGLNQLCLGYKQIPEYKEKGYFTLEDLEKYMKKFNDNGLNFEVMSMGWYPPEPVYTMREAIKAGHNRPHENLCRMVEATGQAGIPVINMFDYSLLGGLATRQVTLDEQSEEAGTVKLLYWSDDEKERAEEWKRAIHYVQALAEVAEKVHTKLAYHQFWVPDVFWNYETQKKVLDEVGSNYVGVCFCIGGSHTTNDDPPTCIRRLGEKVFLVHVRDVRKVSEQKGWMARPAPEGVYETWEGVKYFDALQGTGEVDFPRVMNALKDIGYKGVLMIEHIPEIYGEEKHEIGLAYVIGYLKGLQSMLYF